MHVLGSTNETFKFNIGCGLHRWRQQGLAQDIQECKAHALLDMNGMLLDIAHPILDITHPTLDIAYLTLDSHNLLVMLMIFLMLLLHRCKDSVQLCGGSSTAK